MNSAMDAIFQTTSVRKNVKDGVRHLITQEVVHLSSSELYILDIICRNYL